MEKIDYLAKAISLTDEGGKKFLSWYKSANVVGIEYCENDDWFYPFIQYDDGSTTFLSIPYAKSGRGASHFGDLEYTAKIIAYRRTNLPYFFAGNDRPNTPFIDTRKDGKYLYTKEDVIRWRIEYNKVIEKYEKFTENEPRLWRRNPMKYHVPKDAA